MHGRNKATGSGHVATLDFITFSANDTLHVHGLDITPVALPHGIDCTALGFLFSGVAYLSDLSGMSTKKNSK